MKQRARDAEARAISAESAKVNAETRLTDAHLLGTAQREAAVGSLKAEQGAALLAAYEKGAQFAQNLMGK